MLKLSIPSLTAILEFNHRFWSWAFYEVPLRNFWLASLGAIVVFFSVVITNTKPPTTLQQVVTSISIIVEVYVLITIFIASWRRSSRILWEHLFNKQPFTETEKMSLVWNTISVILILSIFGFFSYSM